MKQPQVPATPVESAEAFDMIRALLVHTLLRSKEELVVTRAQYTDTDMPRVMLRVVMDHEGSMRAWLEEPRDDMRQGVPYVPADMTLGLIP